MAILKAEINLPLVFTPKYADYAESKYGPQVRFKTDAGDLVYLPLDATNILADLLAENGTDKAGKPAWKVRRPAVVSWTRRENKPPLVLVDGIVVSGLPEASSKPKPAEPVRDWGQEWQQLEAVYRRCATISQKVWGEEWPPEATVAGAATVFIAADRKGMRVPIPPASQSFDKPPAALVEPGDSWEPDEGQRERAAASLPF